MKLLDFRLAFRFHRFEILAFGILIILAAVGAAFVAANLDATGYAAHCSPYADNPPSCEAMGRAFYDIQNGQVGAVQSVLMALPFLLGALTGAAVIGREIERGTSRLAWSLAPSRTRWFLTRALPVLVVVFALSFLAGAALDRLTASIDPWTDASQNFAAFGGRGVVLAGRATFVFAIGVAVGAILGRALPALIVTAVIASVAISGGSYVHNRILATEAVFVANNAPGDLFVDQRVRLADGRVVTWDEANALYPELQNGPTDGAIWPPEGMAIVNLVVPASRYRFVEAREVGALAGASLVALVLAAFAVRRRRPG
ncbi:MAG: hypothetical protein ABI573_01570 [Chloroflexota bacterium]